MAKFTTKKLDLELQLTTVDGQEVTISPKEGLKFNATNISQIVNSWAKLEEVKEKGQTMELLAKQLSYVYDEDSEWWMDNFRPDTIQEVLIYVAQTLSGFKKNDKT